MAFTITNLSGRDLDLGDRVLLAGATVAGLPFVTAKTSHYARSGLIRIDDEAPSDVAAGAPRTDAPSMGAGGFKRLQRTPVIDLNAAATPRGFRDPGVYCETISGVRDFTVVGALAEEPGTNALHQSLGYATGPSLTALTYRGVAIDRATLNGVLPGGKNVDKLGASGIVKEGNTYHQYVVLWEHDLATTTTGAIGHFTAPSPHGPWTFVNLALTPSGGELLPMDNCVPVFYRGEWVMAFNSLQADRVTRPLKFATAPTLAGPWTRVASVATFRGGYSAADGSFDSPMLAVDGDTLICFANPNTYFLEHYDASAFKTAAWDAVPLGRVFSVSAPVGTAGDLEAGAPSWGGGGLCHIDDEIFMVYWGLVVTNAGASYPTTFAAKWAPSLEYVPLAPVNLAAGTQIGTTNPTGTIAIPAWVPQEAVAVDLQVNFRETGVVPAPLASGPVEILQVRGANATLDTTGLFLYPAITNMTVAQRGALPVYPGGAKNVRYDLAGAPGTNTGRLTVTLMGYWRQP